MLHGQYCSVGIDDPWYQVAEGQVNLLIVLAKANDGFHLLFHYIEQWRVVVAFVSSAHDPDHRLLHALEREPCGIHIGGLGVVDELDAVNGGYVLQTMLYMLEVAEAFTYGFVGYFTCSIGDTRLLFHVLGVFF